MAKRLFATCLLALSLPLCAAERVVSLAPSMSEIMLELGAEKRLVGVLDGGPRPAKLAGVSELQAFLERGFTAFEALGGAGDFLEAIGRREYEASRRLFAGDPDPFGEDLSRTPRRGSGGSRARSGP